jgi:hypothetical protein
MKPSNHVTQQPERHALLPDLDAGLYNLAAYLSEYIQSLRQLEKKPTTR